MTDLYQENNRRYRDRFPGHPLHVQEKLPENVSLIQTPSGHVSAEINSRLQHSRHNPRKEAERIVASRKIGQNEWILLFGFGLGYIATELCRQYPDHQIFVIDPDFSGFTAAFQSIDLSDLFSHKRLSLLIGPDSPPADALMADLQYNELHIVHHKPSVDKYPEFFHQTGQRLKNLIQRRQVNHNTLKRFGKLWLRNFAANISVNCGAAAVQIAENRFSNIPGLLVAAGPGLNDALPYLTELRNFCVVAAVDTALPILLKAGIDPDIVVVVDPQYWNTRHIDYCRQSQAISVSESSAHPRIFRCLKGPFLFGDSLFPLGRLLESCFGPRGKLGAGGSVATSAFEVLKLFGCREIFCVGLDLGFPEGATHCRGSFFEERVHGLSTRFITSEQLLWRYLVDGGRIQAKDYDGRILQTDARMQIYQQWFSLQLEQDQEIRLRPLSRRGITIDGAEPAEYSELLKRTPIRTIIDASLNTIRTMAESYTADSGRHAQILYSRIQGFLHSMHEIRDIAVAACDHISRAWSQPGNWNKDWVAKLNDFDSQLQMHEAKEVTGFLLQEVLEEIQAESRSEGHPLQGSKTLYEAVCTSAEYHIELLERMTESLTLIMPNR